MDGRETGGIRAPPTLANAGPRPQAPIDLTRRCLQNREESEAGDEEMKTGTASHGLPLGAGLGRLRLFAALGALAAAGAQAQSDAQRLGGDACVEDGRRLAYGFYSDFRPVSHSANPDAGSPGFDEHLGYEADLLTALETLADAGLAFDRKAIDTWPDIWLRPAGADYDFVGGGITILESRTRDANGVERVVFTSGHIAFRQSLLVRAEDAERYATYGDLADARVAVLGGTTGEHRLLVLTGVVNAEGNLAAGTAVHLADGTVLTADGSADYRITAAGGSANLRNRLRLDGPPGTVREVLVLSTDREQLDALDSGRVDAVARGELGNREAARGSASRFVVTALDPAVEYGGFAFDKDDQDLAACIDARISYLTDNRRIGFAEWLEDPGAFLDRARYWNATEAFAQIYAYSVLAELMREQFDGTWRDLAEAGDALSGDGRPIWLRVRHGGRRNENARAGSRPFAGGRWRERRSELQIGAYRPLGSAASGFRAGVSGHLLRVDADVRNGRSPVESSAEAFGYGGAASLVWFGDTGPYAATQARFSLWNADVRYVRRRLSTDVGGHSWGRVGGDRLAIRRETFPDDALAARCVDPRTIRSLHRSGRRGGDAGAGRRRGSGLGPANRHHTAGFRPPGVRRHRVWPRLRGRQRDQRLRLHVQIRSGGLLGRIACRRRQGVLGRRERHVERRLRGRAGLGCPGRRPVGRPGGSALAALNSDRVNDRTWSELSGETRPR